MTSLEQNLLNVADTVTTAAGQLVSAKNPAYAGLITLATSLIDAINTELNPGAAAAQTQIQDAAAAISAGVAPVIAAVKVIPSGSATPQAKASAIGTFIGTIETIGGDIFSIFHASPTGPATVTPAAPAAPAPAAVPGS